MSGQNKVGPVLVKEFFTFIKQLFILEGRLMIKLLRFNVYQILICVVHREDGSF